MIKAAVFDFDYTLYDRDASDIIAMGHYYDEHVDAFNEMMSRDEACRAFVETEHKHNYDGWPRMCEYLYETGVTRALLPYRELTEFVQFEIGKYGVIYPYTRRVLSELREMGMRLGLITNGSERYQRAKVWGNIGIGDEFEHVLIGCDPATAKPKPDLFFRMAELMGIETSEMLYAGDNPAADIVSSRKAGCVPVWIRTLPPWRFPDIEKAPYEADTIEALPGIIASINAE